MLTRDDFLSLNFVKKEDYAGSYKGMRYMLHKEETEEEKKLKIFLWPEPLCFGSTAPELIISEMFEFSEEGFKEGIDWMNEKYPEITKKQST